MPEFSVDVAVFPERADPSALANKGILYTKDVSGVTQLFYVDSQGAIRQITGAPAASEASPIAWGEDNVNTANDTRYMCTGYGPASGAVTTVLEFLVPRDGTFKNLMFLYNANGTGAQSITYTLMVDGVASALTATATNTAPATVTADVAVTSGQRIGLRVTKSGVLGSSPTGVIVATMFE